MVASDGHTYERSAIAAVLQSANPVSPLTREPLEAHVFPNRALKERITEHEEEVLRIAATAYATGIAAAAEEEAPSGSSSHEGAQEAFRARPTNGAAKRGAARPPGASEAAAEPKRRRR